MKVMFSAVPKPDVDFITDLVKQQTDEVPENLCRIYDWISKSANVEDFFPNLFVKMSKEKRSKIDLLTRGQNNNKVWYNYMKGVITVSKAHSVLTKMDKILNYTGGCVNMRSLCQNISELSFTNPAEYGLFLDKVNCFIRASDDRLMICDCCEDACATSHFVITVTLL